MPKFSIFLAELGNFESFETMLFFQQKKVNINKMKIDIPLKNIANIFNSNTDQIANTKGNISKITIKEKFDNLYTEIKNFIEKDSIEQVRQTHTFSLYLDKI